MQRAGAAARDHTGAGGFEAVEREESALLSSWEQWERGALQTRGALETALSQIASSEQEFGSLAARLEKDLGEFGGQLKKHRLRLAQAEGKSSPEEAVEGWQIAKVRTRTLHLQSTGDGTEQQIDIGNDSNFGKCSYLETA